jgi:predicted nucleotidyltransferase
MTNNQSVDVIKTTARSYLPDAEILLFGSRARKEELPDSDYDILLITNNTFTPKEKLSLRTKIRKALLLLGVRSDILIQSRSEVDQKKILGYDYIHYHTFHQLKKFKDFRKDTLHTLIKIQTPWFVTVPKGYSLLCLPVPYNDDIRFTASTGVLKGCNDVNAQLFWHVKKGREVVKKGTLLAQYILIKDEEVDYTVSVANELDLKEREKSKEEWNKKRNLK